MKTLKQAAVVVWLAIGLLVGLAVTYGELTSSDSDLRCAGTIEPDPVFQDHWQIEFACN